MCNFTDMAFPKLSDYWTFECIHSSKVIRRIPGCLPSDGVNGCQSMSSYSNGFGS